MFKSADKNAANLDVRQLIRSEEPAANVVVANFLLFVGACYLAVWIAFKLDVFHTIEYGEDVVLLSSCLVIVILFVECRLLKGRGVWQKYAFALVLLWSALTLGVITGYKTWMVFALPIILSCRYNNVSFTITSGVMTAVFVVLTGLCNIYLFSMMGIFDLDTVNFNGELVELTTTGNLYSAVAKANLSSDNLLHGTWILSIVPNLIITFAVTAICAVVTRNNQRLAIQTAEEAREKADMEAELERGRSKLMVSQIQPHFLYNTLTAIMAIDGNPDETVDAIGDFGKYLRENLDSLGSDGPIPFSKEIAHVKRYASLEQLRFAEKLNLFYDLRAVDFELPALTLQILVENAIKHGISASAQGGSIWISTRENPLEWEIEVKDDGLGFDASEPVDESKHVGLANVRSRLEAMCNGTLQIESAPGEGTCAIVRIPKGQK